MHLRTNRDCEFGTPWSYVQISHMLPGCHPVLQPRDGEKSYFEFVESTSHTGVGSLSMFCDQSCSGCTDNLADFNYGECQSTATQGGVAVYPFNSYCGGSSNFVASTSVVSVAQFTGDDCSMTAAGQELNVALIRNIPSIASTGGQCVLDGVTKKDKNLYYQLNETTNEKGVNIYSGVVHCTDDKCSENCIAVSEWEEGVCQIIKDNENIKSMQIYQPSEANSGQCRVAPPPPPGPGPPPPPPFGTTTNGGGTTGPDPDAEPDEGMLGGLLGGGLGVAVIVFGAAILYRRYEARHGAPVSSYTAISNPNYGTVSTRQGHYDDEGMTTDI